MSCCFGTYREEEETLCHRRDDERFALRKMDKENRND